MPHLYLPTQPVRLESAEVAATLERKGWTILPEQPDPAATWDEGQGEWVVPEPPAPEPQWIEFGLALAGVPAVDDLLGAVEAASRPMERMLSGGLLQAAQGDPRTFLATWARVVEFGLASPELVATIAALATAYNLPADFVAALAPPEQA